MPGIALDSTTVEPGAPITGTISWTGTVSLVSIDLRWHTRGKGDRDDGVALTLPLSVKPGQTSVRFAITAPYAPFSCSGTLVSIIYRAVAVVDGIEAHQELVIGPGGKEVVLAGAG